MKKVSFLSVVLVGAILFNANTVNSFSNSEQITRGMNTRSIIIAQTDGHKQDLKTDMDKELNIVQKDDHFEKYGNGIVFDKRTGLEWFAGPDEKTDFKEAALWVENLNTNGGGWRMPSVAELKKLFLKETGTRNMTPLLKTTGWIVWSGEKKSAMIKTMDFKSGQDRDFWCYGICNLNNFRGFAVRLRK